MGAINRRDGRPQNRQGREVQTGSMRRTGPAPVVDRQVEVARRYYPDGQLEAERLRIRERTAITGNQDAHPGCLVAWFQTMAGFLYIIAVPAAGYWLGGWIGAVAGFVLVSMQAASHW
jgi:hypothetical protein